MCVPTLPWRKWVVKFPRVQQLVLVLFPQICFSRCQARFWHFCRNTPDSTKENAKNTCCSLASYLGYFWVHLRYNKPRNWCNNAITYCEVLAFCTKVFPHWASRGAGSPNVNLGPPNISETKAIKLKLKAPSDIVKYSPWVQKFFC